MQKLNLNLLNKGEVSNSSEMVDSLSFKNNQDKVIKVSKFIENDSYQQMVEEVNDGNYEKKNQQIEQGSLQTSIISNQNSIYDIIYQNKVNPAINIPQLNIIIPFKDDQDENQHYQIPLKKGGSKTSSKLGDKKKSKDKYNHKPFKWSTYQFLLAYPKKHWKLTIITNILIILSSITGVYLPLIIGQLLDSTTKDNDRDLHKQLSKMFLEIMIVLSFLSFLRAFTNQIWQQLIYNDMRRDVLIQFMEFDMQFFRKYRNGEIISRMTNDLESAKGAVSSNIINLARSLIMTVSTISMLFLLSYKLTIAVLSVMPFFTISTMFYTRFSKKYEKIGQKQQADITALAFEIVSGIISVKSFCGEEIEMEKLDKQLEKSLGLSTKRAINNGLYQFSATFFVQLGTLMVLYYGGELVLQQNDLSPGELASFIFYQIQLSNSSSTISEAYSKIISATGAFEGVLDMLKYQSIVQDNQNAIVNVQLSGQITFKNIYFQYPGTNVPILKDLNLTINKGEYVALVGASGSGKSTIVQLIERFYDCQRGTISMDSIDIRNMKIKSLRKQIGLVSQEPTLFEGTLKSNITYGSANYTDTDLDWAVRASGAHTFIHNSSSFPKGLDSFVGERGQTLSGGQKQRIAIARALIKKPKILIFDEATSALDAESEFQVQNAIDDLISADSKNKQEITIIVIAHRLSTIVNCEKICVVSNGVIAECGTHFQLIEQNGIYKNLIDRQMQGMFDLSNNESNEEKE